MSTDLGLLILGTALSLSNYYGIWKYHMLYTVHIPTSRLSIINFKPPKPDTCYTTHSVQQITCISLALIA